MAEVNRWILFAGDSYYPAGGWEDLKGSFATEAEAGEAAAKFVERMTNHTVWWHIVDLSAGQIAKSGTADDYDEPSEHNPDALVGNEESLTIVAGQRSRLKR